jgi:hypothetical protein
MAKKCAAIAKKARVVGATVPDRVRHPAENPLGTGNRSIRYEPSNATHTDLLNSNMRSDLRSFCCVASPFRDLATLLNSAAALIRCVSNSDKSINLSQ